MTVGFGQFAQFNEKIIGDQSCKQSESAWVFEIRNVNKKVTKFTAKVPLKNLPIICTR